MGCNVALLLPYCLVALQLVSKVGTFTIEEVQGKVVGTVLDLRGSLYPSLSLAVAGSIPPALGNLSNLTYIDLSDNEISGIIPPELGQLSKLTYLNLSSNRLSGVIPPELGKLSSLASLDLSKNNEERHPWTIWPLRYGFSGGIPGELFELTGLVQLDLSDNDLTGGIPPEVGRLGLLEGFIVSDNKLGGPIPPSLGNLPNLRVLDLGNNNLTGGIPPALGQLSNLEILRIGGNRLTGAVAPELGKLSNLQTLSLYNNCLSGSIPPALGNLQNLTGLDLGSNRLSGSIPSEIGKLRKLILLRVAQNALSGPIPADVIGDLPYLVGAWLGSNKFSGSIPPGFGGPSLLLLDISSNHLSGELPESFYWPLITNISNNWLTGLVPATGLLSSLSLDLSSNAFYGFTRARSRQKASIWFTGGVSSDCLLQTLLLDYNTPLLTSNLILSGCPHLQSFGVDIPLPAWTQQLALNYLRVGESDGLGTTRKTLDLALAPRDCKYVDWKGGRPINDIVFWDACTSGTGCVVNLIGSGTTTLTRRTRRFVCLNKVSVFLEGDAPVLVSKYDDLGFLGILVRYLSGEDNRDYVYMKNSYGVYSLDSSSFLDDIDQGPSGRAYIGVGFAGGRSGNLCSNPQSRKVILVAFSLFASVLFLSTLGMLAVSRWWQRRALTQTATTGSLRRRRLVAVIAYTWGVISVVVPLVDIATDILVLVEVWGAWPMYVVLACVLAPLAVAGLAVAEAWVVWGRPKVVHRVGFKWVWPAPPAGESALHSPGQSWRLWDVAWTIMLWPLAIAGVIVQDFLAVLDKLGLRLSMDGLVVSFEGYQDSRVLLELLLEAIPQAIFQTVLYRLGSSRATNIYVDDRIFAQSIGASLVTILMQYWVTLWESLQVGDMPWVTFWSRVRTRSRPVILGALTGAGEEVELNTLVEQPGDFDDWGSGERTAHAVAQPVLEVGSEPSVLSPASPLRASRVKL